MKDHVSVDGIHSYAEEGCRCMRMLCLGNEDALSRRLNLRMEKIEDTYNDARQLVKSTILMRHVGICS